MNAVQLIAALLYLHWVSGDSRCYNVNPDSSRGLAKHLLLISVAIVAEISCSSPRKLFIFIIKKCICWFKVPKQYITLILEKTSLHLMYCGATCPQLHMQRNCLLHKKTYRKSYISIQVNFVKVDSLGGHVLTGSRNSGQIPTRHGRND